MLYVFLTTMSMKTTGHGIGHPSGLTHLGQTKTVKYFDNATQYLRFLASATNSAAFFSAANSCCIPCDCEAIAISLFVVL